MDPHEDSAFIAQVVLASGVAAFCTPLPHRLESVLDASEVASSGDRIVQRSFHENMAPMLARLARERNWRLSDRLGLVDTILRIATDVHHESFIEIASRLERGGITAAVFGGFEFANTVYPHDLPRTPESIDLLVRPEHLPCATSIIEDAGFLKCHQSSFANLWAEPFADLELRVDVGAPQHELAPRVKFSRVVELDPYVDEIRQMQEDGLWTLYLSAIDGHAYMALCVHLYHNVAPDVSICDLWYSPRNIALVNNVEVACLSASTLAWYLPSKFYHEFMVGRSGCMQQFVDIIAVVNAFSANIDWDYVLSIVRKYNVEPSLYYVFCHVNEILGPYVPQSILAEIDPGNGRCGRLHDWGDFVPRMLSSHSIISPIFEE